MTAARRRTPSTAIEDALISAAFHLLETEGPEALSVRRVAAEAGVAPMGVYNHFEGGKNGVVDAIFRAAFATLTAELGEVAEQTGGADPADALREGLRRYRRLALEHPRTYEVMFFCSIPGFEPSDESHLVAAASFEVLVAGDRPRHPRRRLRRGRPPIGGPTAVGRLPRCRRPRDRRHLHGRGHGAAPTRRCSTR